MGEDGEVMIEREDYFMPRQKAEGVTFEKKEL